MSKTATNHILGRVLRMPRHQEVRERLLEKLGEYRRRRENYVKEHQVAGYGVLVGQDKTLLDAHYKETLFAALINEGVIRVSRVYHKLRQEFKGYVDDALFHNAIQVLTDYLHTGGSNTSGGSGFLNEGIFREILDDDMQITLPAENRLTWQLKRKYHEYLGRVMEHELHPELPVHRDSVARDTYKARILGSLFRYGSVDLPSLAIELREKEGEKFRKTQFMQAAAVIKSYCMQDTGQLFGGTGLH